MIRQGFNFINIARRIVIRTNHIWPFFYLNRLPYYLALRCLIYVCSKFPEIKSLYLRNSLARGDCTPGLSDIDLTLVIDSGLNAEKEFLFLMSFWRRYERLRKLFPVLDHIQVGDDKHIKIWTRVGIRGYESKYWRLLYGVESTSNNYVAEPKMIAIDSFNHALRVYRNYFLREFFSRRHISLELKRAALKILKYIDYIGDKNNRLEKNIGFYNKEDLLCHIIMEFERRVTSLYAGLVKSRNTKGTINDVNTNVNFVDSKLGQESLVALSTCQGAIESILLVSMTLLKTTEDEQNYFVVLKDGLTYSQTRVCVNSVLKAFGAQVNPFIISNSVFNYMFYVQDPFRYYGLLSEAQTVYGRDSNSKTQLPDEQFLLKSTIEQTTDILTSSRSRSTIFPLGEDSFKMKLRLSLSAKLYLEKKYFAWGWDGLLKKYEQIYPSYYERIVKYKENGSIRERFMLLRDLAGDIREDVLKISFDLK